MEIVIIIGLILLNGILAMSEIALVSARKARLETEAKRGNKSAGTALKLANEPDSLNHPDRNYLDRYLDRFVLWRGVSS